MHLAMTISARRRTSSPFYPLGGHLGQVPRAGPAMSGQAEGARALIQAGRPERASTAKPRGLVAGDPPESLGTQGLIALGKLGGGGGYGHRP